MQLVLGDDEKAYHAYTTNPASGASFYAYNIEAELDAPGEYYLNRQTLRLSFLPPRAAAVAPVPQTFPAAGYTAAHPPGSEVNNLLLLYRTVLTDFYHISELYSTVLTGVYHISEFVVQQN